MGNGDALRLCSNQVVIFGGTGNQLPGAGHGQLLIAKDHETGNVQIVRDFADGQVSLKTGNVHTVYHRNRSFIK